MCARGLFLALFLVCAACSGSEDDASLQDIEQPPVEADVVASAEVIEIGVNEDTVEGEGLLEDAASAEALCSDGPLWGAALEHALLERSLSEPYSWEGEPVAGPGFTHSVASGDPLSDRVILWTRFEADTDVATLDVYWEVSVDATFEQPVASGWTSTGPERDYTVKVDAAGLMAGASYYYRFRAMGHDSPIGRTRTSPAGCLERMRVAVASCASYAKGYFIAYRDIANEADIDVVLHLGDYIYEYGGSSVREIAPPWEILTLSDYRARYAHYRSDLDLQAAHRQHPWIVVWDDHESANDAYADGAQNHNPGEGEWEVRKAIAAQFYAEWMPIRDEGEPLKIWRAFRFGDLVELVMLDTRLWARSPQGGWDDPSVLTDPSRTLLGDDQESWMSERLQASEATWALIGQQVMVGQLMIDEYAFNPDQWDGYQPSRDALFDAIEGAGAENTVVLTGDIHSSWGIDLARTPHDEATYDPETGEGAIAVEFVAPGVTSGVDLDNDLLEFVDWDTFAPHVRYRDVEHRGFLVLDINREKTEALWHHLKSVEDPEASSSVGHAMAVSAGTPHVYIIDEPREKRSDVPPLAP